jgi:hypothetical protein
MSFALTAPDADSLKRRITGLRYTAAEVAEKTRGVYQDFLRQSPRVHGGDFAHLVAPDLALLFDLYDGRFFEHGLSRLLADNGNPLTFRMSRRLTRTAGTTTRFPPRRNRAGMPPMPARYEIAISAMLLSQTFGEVQRPVRVNGLLCRDRVEALQRVFEHELLHLLEMLLWSKSSCSAPQYKALAWSYFGHTETKHDLITQRERASHHFGIRIGDRVAFVFDGVRHVGVVNRITQRATVLVENAKGAAYTNGKRYQKFYIPLGQLEKAPALSPGLP